MALTGLALNRFRKKVDAVLADMFPADLRIAGTSVIASGPGGRITSEYIDGGESTNYRFPFRFPVSSVGSAPAPGDAVDWLVDGSTTLLLEVIECSRRPHENHYQMVCRHRRV